MNYLIIFWLAILTWFLLHSSSDKEVQKNHSYLLRKLNATLLRLREKKIFVDEDLKEIDKIAKGEKMLPLQLKDFLDLENFNKK